LQSNNDFSKDKIIISNLTFHIAEIKMIYPEGEISNSIGQVQVALKKIQITKIKFDFLEGKVEEM
jgi:hypothetical protein